MALDPRAKGALISDYLEYRYGWLWQRTRGIPMDASKRDEAKAWFDGLGVFLEGRHGVEDAAQDICDHHMADARRTDATTTRVD